MLSGENTKIKPHVKILNMKINLCENYKMWEGKNLVNKQAYEKFIFENKRKWKM